MQMKRLLIVFLTIAVLTFAFFSWRNHGATLIVYANPSDIYGNDINYIEVWEGNVLRANFTASGGTVRVNASAVLTFKVSIRLNSTLAVSTSEAISYTAVYMNITGIWTNKEFNNTSVQLVGSFYYLIEQGVLNANSLNEGQTYVCSVLYKAYY